MNADGVTTADSNSKYTANIQSAYVRDTIEITRWLQLIGGVRFDRFDLTALDQNTNTNRGRVDNKLSPQAAVIVKPMENLSFYGVYSISYLPASGDQFSALNNGTVILEPQKFENKEVGVKWNIHAAAAVHGGGLPTRPHQRAARRPEQCRLLPPVGQQPHPRLRDRAHRLSSRDAVAVHARLRLYGRAHHQQHVERRSSPATASSSCRSISSRWWNKYQFTPMWAAAVGVIYFSDSFASSDDTVRLPGFVRFDAAVYAKINETWRAAAQRREHLQQGLLGLGRRQQQHLAGPAANLPRNSDRAILIDGGVSEDQLLKAGRGWEPPRGGWRLVVWKRPKSYALTA